MRGPTAEQVSTAADAYRTAALAGKRPVTAVVDALGVSRPTAHRWLNLARQRGLLPPVTAGRTGTVAEHQPRTVRWADTSESWLACRTCRVPWPCDAG